MSELKVAPTENVITNCKTKNFDSFLALFHDENRDQCHALASVSPLARFLK